MAENINFSDFLPSSNKDTTGKSLQWGTKQKLKTWQGGSYDQYLDYVFDYTVDAIDSGDFDQNRFDGIMSASFEHAKSIDPERAQNFNDYKLSLFSDDVPFEKEAALYEKLNTFNPNIHDQDKVDFFKAHHVDLYGEDKENQTPFSKRKPVGENLSQEDQVYAASRDHFDSLKREVTGEFSENRLPFSSYYDEEGKRQVNVASTQFLTSKFPNFKNAFNNALDSGAVSKGDLLRIAPQLQFYGDFKKTVDEIQRTNKNVTAVQDKLVQLRTAANNIKEQEGFDRVGPDDLYDFRARFTGDSERRKVMSELAQQNVEASKALSAIEILVRLNDLELKEKAAVDAVTATDYFVPVKGLFSDAFKASFKGSVGDRFDTAINYSGLGSGRENIFRNRMPLDPLTINADRLISRLNEEEREFLTNPKKIAGSLRAAVPSLKDSSDEEILDSMFHVVGSALNNSGALNYFKDDKQRHLNIRKFADFGISAHPQLMLNRNVFEKAVAQHPELNEQEKKFLKESRKDYLNNTYNDSVRLITEAGRGGRQIYKSWTKYLEENLKSSTDKKKYEILDDFLADEDNYSELLAYGEAAIKGTVDGGLSVVFGLGALLGSEGAYYNYEKARQRVSKRKELAALFGEDGKILEAFNILPEVGVDIALTGGISAGLKKGTTKLLTKQLASKGYTISSNAATSRALRDAFLTTDSKLLKDKATRLILDKDGLVPLKGSSTNVITKLVDDLTAISGGKTNKLTDLGRVAFSVGAPAGVRSASMSYYTYMDAMPDSMTYEEKRKAALGGALFRGLITAGITVGFSVAGKGSVESFGAKRMRTIHDIKGIRHARASYKELIKMSSATDKAGNSLLNRIVAEVAAKTGREGLSKSIAHGLTGLVTKKLPFAFRKYVLPESIEEGLDEFLGSFVDQKVLNENISFGDRMANTIHAAVLGGFMGGGIPAIATLAAKVKSKLKLGPDESAITEAVYREAVDEVIAEAAEINEKAAALRENGAPMTAEVLEQNRRQLLSGFVKDPVAPAGSFNMTTTANTVIDADRDPEEVVTVLAEDITGMSEIETKEGSNLYQVEYVPKDGSGEVRVAYTKDASVARVSVRKKKVNDRQESSLVEIVDYPLLPNVKDQADQLAKQEGIQLAVDTFVDQNRVSLKNNDVTVVTDPSEDTLIQLGLDIDPESEKYQSLTGNEYFVDITNEGKVVLVLNTSNIAETSSSIPKARRSKFVKSSFVESMAAAFELVSSRNKFLLLDQESTGTLSLKDFITRERTAIYEEMSPYERDRAASFVLGEDLVEGLESKVTDKEILVTAHINSLVQFELLGGTKEVEKSAWGGKARGGALSNSVKEKLLDILDYLRAAVKTAQDTFRPVIREYINNISDKLTSEFFTELEKITPEEFSKIIENNESVEGAQGEQGVEGVEGVESLEDIPVASQTSIPQVVNVSSAPSLDIPIVKSLDFNVPQPEKAGVVHGFNQDTGDTVVIEGLSIDEAQTYVEGVSIVNSTNPNLIEPTKVNNLLLEEGSDYNSDANTKVALVSSTNSVAVDLSDVRTDDDLSPLREAILQNPLFSRMILEGEFDGNNVAFVIKIRQGQPPVLLAVPKSVDFSRSLTEEDIVALKEADPVGVRIGRLSDPVKEKIASHIEQLADKGLGIRLLDGLPVSNVNPEVQDQTDLDVQLSSISSPEEVVEPTKEGVADIDPDEAEEAPDIKDKAIKKQSRLADKILRSVKRRLLREGTQAYESNGEPYVAWYDSARKAIGINSEMVKDLLAQNKPAAGKAIINLAIDEELIHQISWETLTYKERQNAIEELVNADKLGANALIRMAKEYNEPIKGYPVEKVITYLRMGQPEYLDLPEGVEINNKNRSIKESLEEYLFEELVRKHVSLVSRRGSTETDFDWLKIKDNQGILSLYKKYIENFLMGRIRSKNQLNKDSKMGPYFEIAVNKIASEFKAARQGFRRKPDPTQLDDLDIDLGVYGKQNTLIGNEINTVAPEEEEREEWMSEIDPEEVKRNVVVGKTVGTRSPSAKGTEGQGADPNNQVDLASLRLNPEAYKKNALVLLNFPIVAKEFSGDPLLEKVRKAKNPVDKAEIKKEEAIQDIAQSKKKLVSDLISFKVKEKSDQLKPERKERADEARQSFKDSEKASNKLNSDVKRLRTSLTRAKKNLRASVRKEVKNINAEIRKASAVGNSDRAKALEEQKAEIESVLLEESKPAILIEELNSKIEDLLRKGARLKGNVRAAKTVMNSALKEYSKPKVLRSEIKISSAKAVDIIEELAQDIKDGKPVRVGAKSLIVKLEAIKKKENQLTKFSADLKTKTDRLSSKLKALAKAEKAYPIEQADRIYSSLNDVATKNLGMLIRMFPQDLRVFASLWYDGANLIANRFADAYNISLEQSSAILAVNSPQKDWYMNVALAERIMHIFTARQGYVFDSSMANNFLKRAGEPELKTDKNGNSYYEGNATPVYDDEGNHATDSEGILQFNNWDSQKAKDKRDKEAKILNLGLRGKALKDIQPISFNFKGKKVSYSKEALQARFVRMFSEATANASFRDPKTFNVIRPDGAILDRPTLSDKGKPRSIAWGSYSTIEKSIRILEASQDQEMESVSKELGLMHKVRSFYNNIADPSNTSGHVTMDTHAIAALLLKPVSGNSTEVTQNFGGKGTSSDATLGLSGLYPAFAEAYRSVAFQNDLSGANYLVREVQSITWEAVRQLFPPKWKSNKNHVRVVAEIWNSYELGDITFEEAQEDIIKFVQTSKAKGMPEEEALSVSETIDSANLKRGIGVGRPDWGQAAPLTVKKGIEKPKQFSSISWQNLDAKYKKLANTKNIQRHADQLFNLLREASDQAEKRIPNSFTFQAPDFRKGGIERDIEVVKNPKGDDLLKGENKLSRDFILTPANKYAFTPSPSIYISRALGLQEFLLVTEVIKEDGSLLVTIRSGTTEPYYLSGAGLETARRFYGEEAEIVFDVGEDSYNESLAEEIKDLSPVRYEGGSVMPLTLRLAPLQDDLKYEEVPVDDDLNRLAQVENTLRNPYDYASRVDERGSAMVSVDDKLNTNIRNILETVVNTKNVKTGEPTIFKEMAQTLLETFSDDLLNVRVRRSERDHSYSSPDRGVFLGNKETLNVPSDYPNAIKESATQKLETLTVKEWLHSKFKHPIDAILNWDGIKKGLEYENDNYSAFDETPDINDYGDYSDLSDEQKIILERFVKYYAGDRESTDEDHLNFKKKPELQKIIGWNYVEDFTNTEFFLNEGKNFASDKTKVKTIAKFILKGVPPSTVIHEIMHQATQRQFDKFIESKLPRRNLDKKALKNGYKKVSEDENTPQPIRDILKLYLTAIDYGDTYLLKKGSFGFDAPTKRTTYATSAMSNFNPTSKSNFYGLGNIDEFVTESFSNIEFQEWLMSIRDPEADAEGESKSLWDKFVDLITDLINNFRLNPDYVSSRGVPIRESLLSSTVKAALEVASMNRYVDPELYTAEQWATTSGAKAAIKEAKALKAQKKVKSPNPQRVADADPKYGILRIEALGLNKPHATREFLDKNYNLKQEDSKNTQRPNTVETYRNLWDFIEKTAEETYKRESVTDIVRGKLSKDYTFNILDWGSGKGLGSPALEELSKNSYVRKGGKMGGKWGTDFAFNSLEPYFQDAEGSVAPTLKKNPPAESQDFIINNVVMNVATADERVEILQDIYKSLKEGGKAVVTARSVLDVFNTKGLKVVGPAEIVTKNSFQKGFNSESLNAFVKEVLPEAIVNIKGSKTFDVKINPEAVLIEKPFAAGANVAADSEQGLQYSKIRSGDLRNKRQTIYDIQKEAEASAEYFTPKKLQELRKLIESNVPPEIIKGASSTSYTNTFRLGGHVQLERYIRNNFSGEDAIKAIEKITGKPNSSKTPPLGKPYTTIRKIGGKSFKDFMQNFFTPYLKGKADSNIIKLIEDNVPENIIKEAKAVEPPRKVDLVVKGNWTGEEAVQAVEKITGKPNSLKPTTIKARQKPRSLGGESLKNFLRNYMVPYLSEFGGDLESDKDLKQFTKIRGDKTFSQMFSEKKQAEENVSEELSATFDVDVERIFALLGPKMYDSQLKDIVYKESIQNSYDAIKDLENQNPQIWIESNSQPQIEYGLWNQGDSIKVPDPDQKPWKWGERIQPASWTEEVSAPPELLETIVNDLKKGKVVDDKQWVYIRDNGIGMSPEIIKSAYFTLGGSYKESDNPSGGFGLAKISMLRAAQEIFVKTVRDGVESTVKVDNKTLISKKPFEISSRKVDAPSGTQIWMKFPKEIDGESVYLSAPSFHKNILDEKRQLLLINERSMRNTLSLDNIENNGYEKTSVRTLQADIDIFAYEIGDLDKEGANIPFLTEGDSPIGQSISNKSIEYYSNGLFQFVTGTPSVQKQRVPYNIKVNIKPRVPADSMDYPFGNTREKFSPQWSGKTSSDDNHPVEEEVHNVVRKYGREYFKQKFKEEFSIISGVDGNEARPSVPIVYNNLDFDLDPSETELMNDFASIVNNIADQFLGVYKYDFYENDNSLSSNDDVGLALRNFAKADAENDPNFKGVSYHYGSALSKNWGGVNTGINPRVILVNPVYGSLNFTEDGELNEDVGVEGLAAFLTDIILHEVNHVGQRNEGAGFTYPFSAVRAYHSQMNPIFEESNRLIQDLIINKYESIKTLRKKFVKGSTKFLNAELQANKFVNTFAEPNNVRGREVRSRGEIVEQNFGKSVSPDEVQETNRGITVLEAIVGRTFKANEVNNDPPIQRTRISAQPENNWSSLAGKQVGGLYISSEAIEDGYSILEKPSNKVKKEQYEQAKLRLEAHLEEERINAESENDNHVPFSYDLVSIEKDQVRFMLMSDLKEAHPFVVESLRVPHSADEDIQEGRIGNAIFHRMETILGQRHPLYKYHKTITDLESSLGLLGSPSGSERVWKDQIESTGLRYEDLLKEHQIIKDKFFPDDQRTKIHTKDPTEAPEYLEATESWNMLTDILRADIPVMEDSRGVKYLQRLLYRSKAHPEWKKGGKYWSLFFGPNERKLRRYIERSNFFKSTIGNKVLAYKNTTDDLLNSVYVQAGKEIPSQVIMDATGSTDLNAPEEILAQIQEDYLNELDGVNTNEELTAEEKEKAFLDAFNNRETAKSKARTEAIKAAKRKQNQSIAIIRNDSPELADHIVSLRKLADTLSSEVADIISFTAPDLKLRIGAGLQLYLTKQYRIFTYKKGEWANEFLNKEVHKDARDLALDYFATHWKAQRVEHLIKEGGLTKEMANIEAQAELESNDDLAQQALEEFLKSYEGDYGVDSFKRRGNLPEGMRAALGEFKEESNLDILYRTVINLGGLASKLALKDRIVSEGIKAGWLVTQEKIAEETARAKKFDRPNPYKDYEEVSKTTSSDSDVAEVAGSEGTTKLGAFKVKFNPDGTAKEAPTRKPPNTDPLINYRVKTEDGSVEEKGNLLAHPEVASYIRSILNPERAKDLNFAEQAENILAQISGLSLVSKTAGSVPFYERQVLGSFLFLSQNGLPASELAGYIPQLGSEIKRQVFPSGVFNKRSYTQNDSADRGSMGYYAQLSTLGVLDGGVNYALLRDLLGGSKGFSISRERDAEDIQLEIDNLQDPSRAEKFKSKLFPEGSVQEKTLLKAAGMIAGTGSIASKKAQALVLALDNAMKIVAFEYEKQTILAARQDSIEANRNDMYKDMTNAEVDALAGDIILKTQQSRSQSAPIVKFFAEFPVVRVITAPFARFIGENPRLMTNIPRQARAEQKSENPIIQARGKRRANGFIGTNFVLYMAIPKLVQLFVTNLNDEDEREFREGSPKWSRIQNLLYVRQNGQLNSMSFSYVHPMSPILDSLMRGFESAVRGEPKKAIEALTTDYLLNTFLNEQIMFSAMMDVFVFNEDANTGREIYTEYSPDALQLKLKYIYEKGLEPPSLTAARKIIKATGDADYKTGEDARTFMGSPYYSPEGEFFRHITPVKFHALQLEQLARRRFKEIQGGLYGELSRKNVLLNEEKGYQNKQVQKIISREYQAMEAALKDARAAYLVYSKALGETAVKDIMKGARLRKSLVDIVAKGYITTEDFQNEGQGIKDYLSDRNLDIRRQRVIDAYKDSMGGSLLRSLD
tara:strand:- start:9026 stop:27283 length:18258 start_codon:yes stop_codon:yes gene_type:complete